MANGRSDHVTMFSPRLPLTVCRFEMKVSSFALDIKTTITFLYLCNLIIYLVRENVNVNLTFAVCRKRHAKSL